MKPGQPIHLVSFGVVCAVGGTAPVSTAAIRARITGLQLVGPEPDEDDPREDETVQAHVARAQPGEPETGADDLRRMAAQLKQAVAECLLVLPRNQSPLPIAAYLALREAPAAGPLTEVLQNALAPVAHLPDVQTVVAGHAGGGVAIQAAVMALQQGAVQLALIAGVDARTSDEAMARLAADGRLLTTGPSFGFAPGEGAACLLLTTEVVRKRLGLPSRGRVLATGIAKEKNLRGGAPNLGEGLTQALREALDGLPPSAQASDLYCDLNTERYRADEWGFCMPRLLPRLSAADTFNCSTTSTGDVGAASGPLLVAMASADGMRGRTAGPHALISTSADSGERSALLLEVGPVDRAAAQRTRPARGAFEARDTEMIEQMLEEGMFLHDHRLALLATLEEEPSLGWSRLGEVEDRLDAMVDGVAAGGTLGRELAEGVLAEGSPAGVHVGVSALAAIGDWATIWQHLALVTVDSPAATTAAALAITAALDRLGPASGAQILQQGHDAGDTLAPVLLEVAASLGLPASAEAMTDLASRASGLGIGATAKVLGRLAAIGSGTVDPFWFFRWFEDCDVEVRGDVARAWLRTDPAAARREILARTHEPWAIPLLALIGDPTAADHVRGLLGSPGSGPDDLRLLGLWGDAVAVPLLLSRLDAHPDAGAAAEALELLTGAALIADELVEHRLPDEDLNEGEQLARASGDLTAGVEREAMTRLDRTRKRWETWWQENQSRFPAGRSHRAGMPASPAATRTALLAHTLTPSARAALADELVLRHKVRTGFTVTQPVALQLRWLSAVVTPST